METRRWDDLILVARVARPHGLKGEVVLNPESDFLDERFRPGNVFYRLDGTRVTELVLTAARVQRGRPVVAFKGFDVIEDVESLAGAELRIDPAELQPLPEGVYYHHDLIGCHVELVDGTPVGTVSLVDGGGDASRLVVSGEGGDVLVPLAVDICRVIDPSGRRIVIDAPEGLIDLNVLRSRRVRGGRRW